MQFFTKLKPNTLTIRRISCLLLSGAIMINQANAINTFGGPDSDEEVIAADSLTITEGTEDDSLFLDDLFGNGWSDDEDDTDVLEDDIIEGEEDEDEEFWEVLEDDIIEGDTFDEGDGEDDGDDAEEDDSTYVDDYYDDEDYDDEYDSTYVEDDYTDEDEDDYSDEDEDYSNGWSAEDEEEYLAWLEENGFDNEDEYHAYMDSVEAGLLDYDEELDYFGYGTDEDYSEEYGEDWSDEDEEDFLAWLEEMGFENEDEYFAYIDSIEDNEEYYDEDLDYFGDDEDEMTEGEEDDFLDWLEDLGFTDEDGELDEEEEDDFYAWLDEMGFEDEEDYEDYIDSLDNHNIECDDDYDYFGLDEDDYEITDMDEEEEWVFDSEEEFTAFVYELGFECVDDFWAYWYDIEDEWEYDMDYDEELDPFDEQELTEEQEEEYLAWLEELGFEDEEDYYAYLDSMDFNDIEIDEDMFFDYDEDVIEDDIIEGEEDEEDWYFEDEDYFEEEEEYYTFLAELGFEDEEDFYAFLAELEEEYGHLGCDVDTVWMDDMDYDEEEEIIYGETTDCGTSFEFVADSNFALFQVIGTADEIFWSFGDGDYSDEENPTHEFEYSGTYEVCMASYDSTEDCYSEFCDLVDVLVEDEELCDIIITYDFDSTGFLVFDLEFDCYNRSEYEVLWQFGDLNTATTTSGTYGYATEGEYQVCASVRLTDGTILSTECTQVVVRSTVDEDQTSSIAELNKVLNVGTLYPNPANNLTTMNFELASTANLNLTVTDIFGKVVYTANDTYFEGNNSIEISVSELPVGMYTLSVTNNEMKMAKKFSVIH